jgi:diamine N-acetyltransferase
MIKLREIEKDDLQHINAWRHHREVIDCLGCNYHYISEVIDEQWYQHYLKNRDKNVRLSIIDESNNLLIGNVYLTNIHWINRSSEFSIAIGNPDYWSKGIGEEVTRHVLNHAFCDLNLNRVYLYVLETNLRAIKLYEKVGFKVEGKMEEAVYKNGSFYALVMMALLRKQFKI